HSERFGYRKARQLESRLYGVPALLPRERSEQTVDRMMTRLLREHRADPLVAAQVRRVVSLVSGDLAHQTRREDMLPGKRRHIVVQVTPQILTLFLLIGKVGHIELLPVVKEIHAEQILIARRVVEFEKGLQRLSVVMKVLNRWRIEEAIRG